MSTSASTFPPASPEPNKDENDPQALVQELRGEHRPLPCALILKKLADVVDVPTLASHIRYIAQKWNTRQLAICLKTLTEKWTVAQMGSLFLQVMAEWPEAHFSEVLVYLGDGLTLHDWGILFYTTTAERSPLYAGRVLSLAVKKFRLEWNQMYVAITAGDTDLAPHDYGVFLSAATAMLDRESLVKLLDQITFRWDLEDVQAMVTELAKEKSPRESILSELYSLREARREDQPPELAEDTESGEEELE